MRKILKVKTIGSKAEKNLKPIIASVLPQGVNMTVHLYNEVENTCICELWGSNKDFLKADDRMTTAKLNKVLAHSSVLEQLNNHPSSPKKLYSFSEIAEHFEVDDTKKVAKSKKDNKEHSFKRKEKRKRHGEEIEMIVFEEE